MSHAHGHTAGFIMVWPSPQYAHGTWPHVHVQRHDGNDQDGAHHSVGRATYCLTFYVEVTLLVANVEVQSAPDALPNVHHEAS